MFSNQKFNLPSTPGASLMPFLTPLFCLFVTTMTYTAATEAYTGTPVRVCTGRRMTVANTRESVYKDMAATSANQPLLEVSHTGIMGCGRLCLNTRKCKAVNFNTSSGDCQLLDSAVGSSSDYTAKPKMMYGYRSSFPESLSGTCTGHTCGDNQYCVPSSNSYKCKDLPSVFSPKMV